MLQLETIPNLIYVMKAVHFSTHNYSPLQKLFPVVLFLNPLVRFCFSKHDLSCPKGSQIGWNILECKKISEINTAEGVYIH